MSFARSALLICAASLFFAYSMVHAEYKSIEGSVESAEIYLQTSAAEELLLLNCTNCPRTFEVADDFRVDRAGQRTTLDRLREGETGTLIYNLESGEAVRLLLQ